MGWFQEDEIWGTNYDQNYKIEDYGGTQDKTLSCLLYMENKKRKIKEQKRQEKAACNI